jgi:hypothetical protein
VGPQPRQRGGRRHLPAPREVNRGLHAQIEGDLRRLHESVQPGGHVLVHSSVSTFGAHDWSGGPTGLPAGANLVRSVDYAAVVCRPDGTVAGTYRFGYDLSPPTGSVTDGTFRAGQVTAIRRDPIPVRP